VRRYSKLRRVPSATVVEGELGDDPLPGGANSGTAVRGRGWAYGRSRLSTAARVCQTPGAHPEGHTRWLGCGAGQRTWIVAWGTTARVWAASRAPRRTAAGWAMRHSDVVAWQMVGGTSHSGTNLAVGSFAGTAAGW
jgi:hypothetical protein